MTEFEPGSSMLELDAARRRTGILVELAREMGSDPRDLTSRLQRITEAAANALEIERVSIWSYNKEQTKIRCLDLFERSEHRHTEGTVLEAKKYPVYFRALEEERTIAAGDAHNDPRTMEFSATYLKPLGIGAMLDAPIRVEGQMVGVVCHEHVGESREWPAEHQNFAGSMADFVSLAMESHERALAEENLRTMANAVPVMLAFVDRETRFKFNNRAYEECFAIPLEKMKGLEMRQVIGEDVYRKFEHQVKAALGGQAVVFEHPLEHSDGRTLIVQVMYTPRRGYDGEVDGFYVVITDITARKHEEEERRRLESRMQQTQKLESLGILAGGIAHDFNNLLVGVQGNAGLAKMQIPSSSPIQKILDNVITASQRAADLCRELLAYSGKGKFVVRAIDLSEVVKEMVELLKLSISKDAMLKCALASDLPAIEADVTQVRQVVMNLITNASEALPHEGGEIEIRTGVTHCDRAYLDEFIPGDHLDEGQYVYLEVSDTGCGMDIPTLHNIFDPFFTTKFTGRGLGLAAIQGIVRSHKGAIRVTTIPGSGSTFRVMMPASSRPVEILTSTTRLQETRPKGGAVVLVIDDEAIIRDVVKRTLELMKFRVICAVNGPEALEIFRQQGGSIDVVLLDLTMPGMSGEEVFHEIRSIRPDVRVILSSGYNEQDAISRFSVEGLAGFIQKPWEPEDLIQKVFRVLGEKSSG